MSLRIRKIRSGYRRYPDEPVPMSFPVYFRNFETLTEINLPLAWDSDDLLLTEVSFEGTRVDSVDYKPVVINNDEQKVQINIMPIFSDPIFAGRGLLAKLHFSVSPTADPAFVAVYDTEIAPAGGLFFVDQMMEEALGHVLGIVMVLPASSDKRIERVPV